MNPSENYMNQMPLPGKGPKSGPGPIIAVIIIIALLAFGGYYFWNQVQEQKPGSREVAPELQATTTEGINAELEANLRAMQNDDLGESDMESVDQEFQSQ